MEKMGALEVPQIHPPQVLSSDFFEIKERGNMGGTRDD